MTIELMSTQIQRRLEESDKDQIQEILSFIGRAPTYTKLDQKTLRAFKPKERRKPRDWSIINERQAKQDLYAWELISLAVDALNIEPKQRSVGRPPANPSDQIKLAILKIYNKSSFRRQHSFNMLYANSGFTTKLIKRTTISQVFTDERFTQYLEEIYRTLANFLIPYENSFSIDATGFSSRYNSRWVQVRLDFQKHKMYKKLHVVCGTHTGIISEVKVSKGTAADSPFLKELIGNTHKRFDIQRVCADAGYLSRKNVQFIENVKARPFIMPKKNTIAMAKGHYPAWNRMINLWKLKPDIFHKNYHLRSRSENVFSMMKITLLDGISSKTSVSQNNELLIRVICHNLSVIIEAIFKFGIDPYKKD